MWKVKNWAEPLIHFSIWLAGFILVAVYVNNIGNIRRGDVGFIYTIVAGTLFNIAIFYIASLVLIPRYRLRKYRKFLFTFLLLLLLGLSLLETSLDYFFLSNYYSSENELYISQFIVILMPNMFFLAIAIGYGFILIGRKEEQKQQELKSEKLSAELNYLKAQVNPHFLFNMLNLAFASATKKGDEFTADLIEKIASQMRYMLYDSNVDKVAVSKEIEHIQDFISLQKLRLSSDMPVIINYQTRGNFNFNTIAPLLLIPFVENTFKHGLTFDEPTEITIDLSCFNNVLELRLANPIRPRKNFLDHKNSGIGLENVKKRLQLIYPNMHSLEISEKNAMFNVFLKIQLN